ncbi:MAG: hypothetical protein QOF19_2129 [Alphaproteobacteria bacterium]|jgi:hypothetical protein|nr:hypothetical protein [Alphaproteobacteria bacterium]
MNITRLFPVFSATFAVVYVLCVDHNLALFTYHPQLNQWEFLVAPSKGVTPMYWYGWLATSALSGIAVAALAAAVPRRWSIYVWSGWTWVLPLAAMLYIAFVLRGYFFR